jgi:hypothetical protein
MAQTFTPSGFGHKPLPPPDEPTDAMPGTARKQAVMAARVESGRHPHHPLDARDSEMSRGYAAEQPEANTRKPHGNKGKKHGPKKQKEEVVAINESIACKKCHRRVARTRGQCPSCYGVCSKAVRAGETTWEAMEAEGKASPRKPPNPQWARGMTFEDRVRTDDKLKE